jgi:hypothetical protein
VRRTCRCRVLALEPTRGPVARDRPRYQPLTPHTPICVYRSVSKLMYVQSYYHSYPLLSCYRPIGNGQVLGVSVLTKVKMVEADRSKQTASHNGEYRIAQHRATLFVLSVVCDTTSSVGSGPSEGRDRPRTTEAYTTD